METRKETDLYEPVKQMLMAQGFVVKGEVKGCDVAAVKGEALWVVELKLQMNIKLLYQAMDRQRITSQVFIAIPRPRSANDKYFRAGQRILKKLEIGLITVSLDSAVPTAEIIFFPGDKPHKNNKASERVRKEIAGRIGDTTGGIAKSPVNTAYRERCVKIACLLERRETLSARELVNVYSCEKDALSILRSNHYNWFKKAARGLYALSAEGRKYLCDNASNSVIAYYRMKASEDFTEEK